MRTWSSKSWLVAVFAVAIVALNGCVTAPDYPDRVVVEPTREGSEVFSVIFHKLFIDYFKPNEPDADRVNHLKDQVNLFLSVLCKNAPLIHQETNKLTAPQPLTYQEFTAFRTVECDLGDPSQPLTFLYKERVSTRMPPEFIDNFSTAILNEERFEIYLQLVTPTGVTSDNRPIALNAMSD